MRSSSTMEEENSSTVEEENNNELFSQKLEKVSIFLRFENTSLEKLKKKIIFLFLLKIFI